ncbi:MAG: thioredoxin family protein [Flavobacteriales bacterium]|nr:thioredoxin family protein [Bacteroidota bacterium]MCB9241893.1 thioredoxin family protein [Flavobacteriales bacterium]
MLRTIASFTLALTLILCLSAYTQQEDSWLTNLKTASEQSQQTNRPILLNFSGSDWCANCLRLKKEVFSSEAFTKYADTSLVLVHADFPRMKKNRLPQEQQAYNDSLASVYNPNGIFPYVVLLNSEGVVLGESSYFPGGLEALQTKVVAWTTAK